MSLSLAIGLPILIGLGPVAVLAAVFLWKLHADDRHDDLRTPKPLLRLSLVLALTGSLGALAASWLAVASVLRLARMSELLETLTPVSLLAIIGLCFIPIINAAYLWWLRHRRGRKGGKRRPPPWSPDD